MALRPATQYADDRSRAELDDWALGDRRHGKEDHERG